MAFLQSLLTSHNLALIVGVFAFISWILTGVGTLLQTLGDTVPGWLGTAISWLGTVAHFVNGLTPTASAAISGIPPVASK